MLFEKLKSDQYFCSNSWENNRIQTRCYVCWLIQQSSVGLCLFQCWRPLAQFRPETAMFAGCPTQTLYVNIHWWQQNQQTLASVSVTQPLFVYFAFISPSDIRLYSPPARRSRQQPIPTHQKCLQDTDSFSFRILDTTVVQNTDPSGKCRLLLFH